uniref:Uncharacterized protein n=1 Tax=Cannabis sativa TaxID=3483 RepID=A0A803PH94_CANSA
MEINKIEIVRRQTIKPSYPTPPHQKHFNLSFLDQIAPAIYTSIVLFYPKNYNNHIDLIDTSYDHHGYLKKTLSKILARSFFPLAGRINNNTTIECTDEGVPFFEAKFKGSLSTFLEQKSHNNVVELLKQFLPANNMVSIDQATSTWPLLLVQVTSFDCGGLAIGVCMSHKFADAATLSIFMKSWAKTPVEAAIRDGCCDQALDPDYRAASLFPGRDLLTLPPATESELNNTVDIITKRYVFGKTKIVHLKAKATKVNNPTRVEVVTAFVWNCATNANKRHRFSVLAQCVNLRKKVEPPFPDNLVGNLVGYFSVSVDCKTNDEDYNKSDQFCDLVAKLRKGNIEYSENEAKKLRAGKEGLEVLSRWSEEGGELVRKDDANVFICSSWCNFGFYEIDFGWEREIATVRVAQENSSQNQPDLEERDTRGKPCDLQTRGEETTQRYPQNSQERQPEEIEGYLEGEMPYNQPGTKKLEIPHRNKGNLGTQPGIHGSSVGDRQHSLQAHRKGARTNPNRGNETNQTLGRRAGREEARATARYMVTHN